MGKSTGKTPRENALLISILQPEAKSILLKNSVCILFLSFLFSHLSAQPLNDTLGLKPQKENIITAETIIKIENLGTNINTPLPELRPTVSADGNILFFICENHPSNTKYNSIRNSQDIWYAVRNSEGVWSEAIHMGYPLNTYHYNAVFWIGQ